MTLPPVVRLANDVAAQFHHQPHDQAVANVATHLRMFWDPRMRAQLVAHLDSGGSDLDPIARDAAEDLRASLPQPVAQPPAGSGG